MTLAYWKIRDLVFISFIMASIVFFVCVLIRVVWCQCSVLDKFNELKALVKRVESLPSIEKYRSSASFLDRPFNNLYTPFH